MRLKILPYKMPSKSAKALAQGLGCLRIRNPRYRQRRREIILNWGRSEFEGQFQFGAPHVLNHPYRVWVASNKLSALKVLRQNGLQVPDFTGDLEEARAWIEDGEKVFCRTLLSSHSGRGIIVAREAEQLVPAPLYTKYVKKEQEYRVHVFLGEVIDVSQKRLRNGLRDTDNYEPLIRNHANGWVFCRERLSVPECVAAAAKGSVAALGLEFGAVDIGVKEGVATAYEVNTAPGLEGTTLTRYIDAVNKYRVSLTQA